MTEAEESIVERSPLRCLEEKDIAFDPTTQALSLSKEEKRRTTALMMAIQAYDNIIIKDAEMYVAVSRDQDRGGPPIRPATMDAIVVAAIKFDAFIAGKLGLKPDDDIESRLHPGETETS